MEANELRLNNIISYCGVPVRVSNLGNNGFETIRDNGLLYGDSDVEKYKAIPLTEEILIKTELTQCLDVFEIDQFYTIKFVEKESVYEFDGYYLFAHYTEYETNTLIFFVHQLQNLYFVLKDKELEIKL